MIPDSVSKYLPLIERHQLEVEKANAVHAIAVDNHAIIRRKFHEMMLDNSTPVEDIVQFVRSNDEGLGGPLLEKMIVIACETRRTGRIFFTKSEPIKSTIYILYSLHHILNNTDDLDNNAKFIIATDSQYRPHAQVTIIDDSCFSILISRYLISDSYIFACSIYDIVFKARSSEEMSFLEAFSKPILEKVILESHHRIQLPYALASLFVGEKLRCCAIFDRDTVETKAAYAIHFCTCMIVFILAHELGHIVSKHLEDRSDAGASPFIDIIEDHISNIDIDSHQNRAIHDIYLKKYAPAHSKEFAADAVALQITLNVSVDLFENKYPGLAAAFVVICIISTLDKLSFFVRTGHSITDLLDITRFNRVPFAPDLRAPQKSHPWGKTRFYMLQKSFILMNMLNYPKDPKRIQLETEQLNSIALGAHSIVNLCDQESFFIISEISVRDGEITATVLPDYVCLTQHFKDADCKYYCIPHGSYLQGPWCDITHEVNSARTRNEGHFDE